MPRLSKIGAAALAAFGWTSGSAVSASYLVVAGGGAGGLDTSGGFAAGGGGAGGLLTGTASLNPTLTYTITIGAGAAVAGTSGSDSVFSAFTSIGGGSGGYVNLSNNGATGGSGGGGGAVSGTGGAATSGQGNAGGTGTTAANTAGGGGGGANAVGGDGSSGSVGGAGGNGVSSSISGSSVTYAGGGGGGAGFYLSGRTGTGGTGGTGGGGAGSGTGGGTSGTANLGGGGGGSRGGYVSGGNGGSGIVIISYAGAQQFSGGVVTSSGGNTIHTFTTSGTLGPVTPLSANYLVVAGGGGGAIYGGGGGAGGLLTGTGLVIDPSSIYIVAVGAGGAGTGTQGVTGVSGSNSAFYSITSTGGGGAGAYGTGTTGSVGLLGGSGGGGGSPDTGGVVTGAGGAGTSGQGFAGGYGITDNSAYRTGGGGGGASAAGANATSANGGNGGNGTASSISGLSVTYAGGGGGGTNSVAKPAGTGGTGGGGTGGAGGSAVGTNGTSNTGGGGGGASAGIGGTGGSGVVIISYAGSTQLMAGGVVTIAGGNVIHTFNSSGYLTPLTLLTRSLRFRSSASAYLSRTFGTPTSANTWSWSGWIKRGTLSTNQMISGWTSPPTYVQGFGFTTTNTLAIYNNASGGAVSAESTAVYRDPAAWYHLLVVSNGSSTTAYINSQSVVTYAGVINLFQSNGEITGIGTRYSRPSSGAIGGYLFDGYMAEVNFIDGQALAPTAFGTVNSYGVWQPITYGGSYGNNGFRLPFTNNASTTTLGYDFSPQGNNWTTNNISVTAGATYDSMTDVPTLTSATAANYCVGNPLASDGGPLAAGNLSWGVDNTRAIVGGIAFNVAGTSNFYMEATVTAIASTLEVGIVGANRNFNGNNIDPASYANGYGYISNGNKKNNNSATAYGATFTTGDVIGIYAGNGTLTFYKNNTSQGAAFTGLTGDMVVFAFGSLGGGNTSTTLNFGQQPFVYTPPSGYLALNTFNL
jgi:hypothetical protein